MPSRIATENVPWTWEKVLNDYPRKEGEYPGAAPVSAFKYQKVPLAPYWDRIAFKGTVGEMELDASLDNYVSFKKKLLHEQTHRKDRTNESPSYWFVEVVEFEGYLLKVRFLGFSPNLINKVMERERWIHYNQLQEIGYYKPKGIATIPLIPGYETENRQEILDRLFQQIVGKFTINPLRSGWLQQAEECIKWKTGVKVEVRNRDCCNEMLRGYVRKTLGRRVEVQYWGTSMKKGAGIWVHGDSDLIQPEGWCKTTGGKMNQSIKHYDPPALSPKELRIDLTSQEQLDAFAKMKVGMLFEFINPIRMDEIALGEVTCVLNHGYFKCRIASSVLQADLDNHTGGSNEFHYHLSSGQLFPLGTFFDEKPSPRPVAAGEVEEFDWDSYMTKNGLQALVFPPKAEKDMAQIFEEYMWVEAVDSHRPELVCPAVIVKIVHPHAMKIRFLGWPPDIDQWKPIKTLEVFPIGWCQFSDYVLEPPNKNSINMPFIELPARKLAATLSQTSLGSEKSAKKGRGRSVSSVKSPTATPADIQSPPALSPQRVSSSSRKTIKTPTKLSVKQRLDLEWEMRNVALGTGTLGKGTKEADVVNAMEKMDDIDDNDDELVSRSVTQKRKRPGFRKTATGSKNRVSGFDVNKPTAKRARIIPIRESSSEADAGSDSAIITKDLVTKGNGEPTGSGARRRSARSRSSTVFFGDNVATRMID